MPTSSNALPNFLVLGAHKAGTTSMHAYLSQHPQIFMSEMKEPCFFAYEGGAPNFDGIGDDRKSGRHITRLQDYYGLFSDARDESVTGESSTVYLYSEKAVERIKHYVPTARMIAILRNPVDRAYSHYLHMVRMGREPYANFRDALDAEEERRRNNWATEWLYKRRGLYYAQVKRYFNTFNRDQVKIFLFDDLQQDNLGVLKNIFSFLNVDETFVPDISRRHSTAAMPRSRTIAFFLYARTPVRSLIRPLYRAFIPERYRPDMIQALRDLNQKPPPSLGIETRSDLVVDFREDILRLQDLIDRDLSKWHEI